MHYCNECAKENGWPITLFKSQGLCEECKKAAVCNEMPSSKLPKKGKPETIRCQICGSNDVEHVVQTEVFHYGPKRIKVEVPDYESIKCKNCGESVGFPESVKRAEVLLKEVRANEKTD